MMFALFGTIMLVYVLWICAIWIVHYGTAWHARGLIVAVVVVLIVLWRLQI